MATALNWGEIEKSLERMAPVEGGFSKAKRGLVTLPDGKQIFVKLGTEESTRKWAKKEVALYRFLKKQGFTSIPELLATNADETAFAIEALTEQTGWDWSNQWTIERLETTLSAVDELAKIFPEDKEKEILTEEVFSQSDDGWGPLAQSEDMQELLRGRLRAHNRNDLVDRLDFNKEAQRSARFVFRNDVLGHHDIRADNCAWNAEDKRVKLVDWNWAQIGDPRIDISALLVNVQNSGLDVLPAYRSRLDSDGLHWIAGFWFKSAVTPIWPGGPEHLRDFQLHSGITALDLVNKLKTDGKI